MQKRAVALVASLLAAALLAACSGGGSSPNSPIPVPSQNPNGGNPGPDPNGYNADSIGAVNAIGAPMDGNTDPNDDGGGIQSQSKTRQAMGLVLGQCTVLGATSVKFISPDSNNDPNSSELTRYADTSCTANDQIVDTVRLWTSTGSNSENVAVTISKWVVSPAQGGTSSPNSVRTAAVVYSNAKSFNALGFPIFQSSPATTRTETTQVSVNGTVVSNTADEFVYGATLPNGNTYCGDTTGYNTVGSASLAETFGWGSQTDGNNGTRIVNTTTGDVTFSTNRIGFAYTGPVGFMGITTNPGNTSCPINTPMFSANVNGGFLRLPFTVPIVWTFNEGFLKAVSVKNAVFGNNLFILNVTSTTPQTNKPFITGNVTTPSGSPIATFTIGINGFGTLSVIDGHAYQIADWHIVADH